MAIEPRSLAAFTPRAAGRFVELCWAALIGAMLRRERWQRLIEPGHAYLGVRYRATLQRQSW